MQTKSELLASTSMEGREIPAAPASGVLAGERMSPWAVPVSEACRISGFSKSELYLRMKRGEIQAKKAGRSTLVLVTSLRAAVESLPAATFRAPKQATV